MAEQPAALLWDFDGTTVDGEPAWERAEERYLSLLGGPRAGVDIPRMDGASLEFTLQRAHDLAGVPFDDRQRALRTLNELAVEEYLADGPVPLPGVCGLLAEARAAGLANALVSANATWVLERVVPGIEGIEHDQLVGEDVVAHPKPAPDMYLEACRLLGVAARDCIAFEDSVNGARAAVAAGCFTVGVTGAATEAADGVALRLDGLAGVGLDELVEAWRSWRRATDEVTEAQI